MEKFMLIFQGGRDAQLSPDEMQAHMGKWFAWITELNKTGTYVSGEPLLPGGKLVSGKGGKNVTDGPYTEGKELVGGYFIVNADNYDDAVNIAQGCPTFEVNGTVQVRQVQKVNM